ncbi:DoxX family protein [Salipaludibacillus daqingensis]|uniref:DoxX family protein n=1 Tax=Salipaludibacillus daqingensis TaxID=3041001 RepID=UPI0024746359|nr:DoxX family protein [Salipaludibacillus daqingensis]
MITIIVLLGSFALFLILSRSGLAFRHQSKRELAAYAMAVFLVFFGTSHFFLQEELVAMVPDFLPYPVFIVYLTGIIEIVLAAGLIIPGTRRWSGILLAIYFVAVFPANVIKAMSDIEIGGTFNSPAMSWVRLLFQPIFIVWALYCSKVDR